MELYLTRCEENLYGSLEVYWLGDIASEFLLVRCRRSVFCSTLTEDVVRSVFDWLCIILTYDEVCRVQGRAASTAFCVVSSVACTFV